MKTVRRLMIIDDDELNNYIITKIVEYTKLAEKVEPFVSADKALKYLRENSLTEEGIFPEIILLDLSMYYMNGWEFLDRFEKLRIEYTNRISVFILTTSLNKKDQELVKKYRCIKGFYNKPLTIPIIEDIRKKVTKPNQQFMGALKVLLQVSF